MKLNHRATHTTKTLHNRLLALLAHTTYFAFNPRTKLAAHSRLSYSTIYRVGKGEQSPSLYTALTIL
jgi:hypothetical protein